VHLFLRENSALPLRLIETIPHPECRICIYSYNDKYILEVEIGIYKQTFKMSHDSVSGVADIRKLVDARFMDSCMQRFHGMREAFQEAKKNIQTQ
jgi:hypothetical protein